MIRNNAIFISMFFLCLGVYSCKSPEAPEEPEPNYEYRYNVEVIYTRTTVDYPTSRDWVQMHFSLYDPALYMSPHWSEYDLSVIDMEKIGKDKYRCYLSKVFIQDMAYSKKHHVYLAADLKRDTTQALVYEDISIQGAYDREIKQGQVYPSLYFRMSKD